MPIILKGTVAKTDGTVPAMLQRLRQFVADNQTGLVTVLYRLWDGQQQAVTYKELREAILAGAFRPEDMEAWRQDYSAFISDTLGPKWEEAMRAAARQIKDAHPEYDFDPAAENVRTWTAQHSAELVTSVTEQQRSAINTLVRRAATAQDMTVDELARAIRPTVGLTRPQAAANFNYYTNLRKNGIKAQAAQEKAAVYAGRQHRYRAQNIARTELAMAYNNGEYLGIKQAQEQGVMGGCQKKWMTAHDGRVCENCADMDGMEIAMDAYFPIFGGLLTPTAHPSCRCCLVYEETGP